MTKYKYTYSIGQEILTLSFSKPLEFIRPSLVQATFKKALIRKNIDLYSHISKLGFETKVCNICKIEYNPYINIQFEAQIDGKIKITSVWYGMLINNKINYDRHYCYGKNQKCPGLHMNSNSIEYVSATLNLTMDEAKEFIHQNNKSPFYLENHNSVELYAKSQARGLGFFIRKYGDIEGTRRFSEYDDSHKYTSSKQYQIDKFGESEGTAIWEDISKRKAITLANLQMKFGEDIGIQKFNEWKVKISSANAKIIEKMGYEAGKKFIEARNSKRLETLRDRHNIQIIPKELRLDYLIYVNLVWDETHESLLKYSHVKFDTNFKKTGLSLDHQVSIKFGFMNGISPTIIGHIENLNYISKHENSKKRDMCSMSIKDLMIKIREHDATGN